MTPDEPGPGPTEVAEAHDYRLLHKAIFWGLMISMIAILATDAVLLPFEIWRFGWGG